MSALLFFSSVPDMVIPGMAQPGRDGQQTAGAYLYIGQGSCYYLDYLDAATGDTLAPVTGGYYTMIPVSGRPGLSVPPPGRPWTPGGTGPFAPQARPPRREPPAAVSHGHYPGAACAQCDPGARDKPAPPRRTPGPDVAPHDYAAEMATARAHTASLHAAWAQGRARPGEHLAPEEGREG